MRSRLREPLRLGLLIGLIGVIATVLPPIFELEEGVGLQTLFALRGAVPAPQDVIVVAIGRDSAEALELDVDLTEWPRSQHAELLDRIVAGGASAVAFDVMFREPRNPTQDEEFARALSDSGSAILLDRMERSVEETVIRENRLWPLAIFRNAAVITAPFPLPVVPIRTSQFWAFLPSAADAPTLPVATLQVHLIDAIEPFCARLIELRPTLAARLPSNAAFAGLRRAGALESLMRELRAIFSADPDLAADMRDRLQRDAAAGVDAATLGRLATLLRIYDGPSSRYVNYYGPPQSIATVPYDVAVAQSDTIDWSDKAVFIGFSERTQPDQQDSFISVFSERSGLNLSGVEIAATALANLLEGRTVTPLPGALTLLLAVAWGALVGTGLALLSTGAAIATGLAAGLLYAGLALQQFASASSWWPLVVPLLIQLPIAMFGAAWMSYSRAHGRSERLVRATRQYLPDSVVRRMEEDGLTATEGYELVDGICLVTDAEQYTALSESMPPAELAALLNEYYEVLFGIVTRLGGQVTDVVGDSMVAVWISQSRSEERSAACGAALEIVAAQTRAYGPSRVSLPTRVGLHGGEFLLGTIGAEQHREYRAVGDTVNSASRIQELNKQLGTRVLSSRDALAAGPDWVSRELGVFLLAGKQSALAVSEIMGPAGSLAPVRAAIVEPFALALGAYEAGELDEAFERFRELSLRHPDDGPSRFYRLLCEQALRNPSDRPWDPTVRLSSK